MTYADNPNSYRHVQRQICDLPKELDAVFDFQHLLATIHACFQVDMMWAVQFTSCFIFDIGVTAQRIMGASHIPL